MKLHSDLRLASNGFDVTIPDLGEKKRYRAFTQSGITHIGMFRGENEIDYEVNIPSYEMAIIAALLYEHFDILLATPLECK